jgi:peptidoglycan hydrolase-like protein with peptidoglycan-binding domain
MQSITISNPTLKLGSQGAKVHELQKLLNSRSSRDYWLSVDGRFGTTTESLVKTMQRIYFLQVDGIVGPLTWKALQTNAPVNLPMLRRGSEGELVKRVQQALVEGHCEIELPIDGSFGPRTEAAVKAFQLGAALAQDGIIGPKTWKALSMKLACLTFAM